MQDKMARPAFFSERPRLFQDFGLEDQDLDPKMTFQKIKDYKVFSFATKNKTETEV